MKPVGLQALRAIHIFTDDWIAAAHWWARMTGAGTVERIPLAAVVNVWGLELLFCPADERNPIGGSPVPYFRVEDFGASRDELKVWQCVELHYPLKIPGDEQITQFRDPFGNIFGIYGPVSADATFWPEARAEAEALRELDD